MRELRFIFCSLYLAPMTSFDCRADFASIANNKDISQSCVAIVKPELCVCSGPVAIHNLRNIEKLKTAPATMRSGTLK